MTKKPFSLFLFALLLCVTKTLAQYELNGMVITKNQGEKMPYAAVSLFMAQDSTFYKGTSADDEGLFRFENVEKGIYFLEAVFMSNVSERVAVDVMSDTNFGSVVLPEAVLELEEVVVAHRGMRHHQDLHRHAILFHDVVDAGIGVDDEFVGERAGALAVG